MIGDPLSVIGTLVTDYRSLITDYRSARNSGVIFGLLSWPGLHRPGLAVQGMAGLLVSIIACGCLVVMGNVA